MAQNDKPVIVTLTCEAREGTETLEIDRAEWDSMTPAERLELVEDAALEHVNNQGGWGWAIEDPADEAAVADAVPDLLRELAEWLVDLPSSWSSGSGSAMNEAITRAREALGRTEEET